MTTKELKELEKEFSEFYSEEPELNAEAGMSNFWFAHFGVSNKEREAELLEYWKDN